MVCSTENFRHLIFPMRYFNVNLHMLRWLRSKVPSVTRKLCNGLNRLSDACSQLSQKPQKLLSDLDGYPFFLVSFSMNEQCILCLMSSFQHNKIASSTKVTSGILASTIFRDELHLKEFRKSKTLLWTNLSNTGMKNNTYHKTIIMRLYGK